MNGLLSKIWGGSSDSQDPVEEPGRREDVSLLRERTRIVDASYRDCGTSSRSGGSWWDKAKSWFTWDTSPKYGQMVVVARAAVNVQEEDNSRSVLPSSKLEDVVGVSAACSSDTKEAMAANTSSSHGNGQRCYGGGGDSPLGEALEVLLCA